MNKLVINMITHNDAVYLPVVIPALCKFADRILIFDNGSVDESAGIAKDLLRPNDLLYCNYDNDLNLSCPRNSMINQCQDDDWIFKWDSDELPSDQMIAELPRFLKAHDEIGWGVPCYHIHKEPQHALSFEYGFHHMCLFKKTSKTHYAGAVHATVIGLDGPIDNIPLDTGISIIHFSYWAVRRFREKAVFYTTQEGSGFTAPNDLLQRLDWSSIHLPANVTYQVPAAWMEKLRNAS